MLKVHLSNNTGRIINQASMLKEDPLKNNTGGEIYQASDVYLKNNTGGVTNHASIKFT